MASTPSAVQYVSLNVGVKKTPASASVQAVSLNVGVKKTPSATGFDYAYLNTTLAPTQAFLSDNTAWIELDTVLEAESRADETFRRAKSYTNGVVGDLSTNKQLVPRGGAAGQVLKKVSADDYDAKWANESGGGGGGMPAGGTAGQILTKDSTIDGDATWHDIPTELPATGADGLVLLTDAASPKKVKWSALPGGSRDRISVCPATWTSIDEFNDDTLGADWVRVDSSTGAARCTWTEKGDTLSTYNSGGDASGELHALLLPLTKAGGDMAVGDAFVTCITIAGHVQTSANHIGGLILANGSTYGAGVQQLGMSWTNGVLAQMNHNPYKFTNFNTATSGPTSILTVAQRMFIRLVMTAANTWRHDISVDGVSWLPGTAIANTLTPTHVGLVDSSWGNSAKHVLAYEFLRRMRGVT